MYKNLKEKMNFMLHLMIHLTVQSRGTPKGTPERAPNNTFSNLHKDAQKGAFEVALGLHLCLHLLLLLLIYKFVQNGFNMFAFCFISIEPSIFLQQMVLKEQRSFSTLHARSLLKWHQVLNIKSFRYERISERYQEFLLQVLIPWYNAKLREA